MLMAVGRILVLRCFALPSQFISSGYSRNTVYQQIMCQFFLKVLKYKEGFSLKLVHKSWTSFAQCQSVSS